MIPKAVNSSSMSWGSTITDIRASSMPNWLLRRYERSLKIRASHLSSTKWYEYSLTTYYSRKLSWNSMRQSRRRLPWASKGDPKRPTLCPMKLHQPLSNLFILSSQNNKKSKSNRQCNMSSLPNPRLSRCHILHLKRSSRHRSLRSQRYNIPPRMWPNRRRQK